MSDISNLQELNSIKTISVTKVVLLNIITFGLYSLYWYVDRSRSLARASNRKLSPALYLVAICLAAWKLFYILLSEGIAWAKWVEFGPYFITFIWILWLSRMVSEIWKVRLAPNKILSTIWLLVFGHMYLQHKLNLIAASKEQGGGGAISSDKWLNRFIIPCCVLFLILIFMRMFFIGMYNFTTTSMVPTIIPGDRIISSKVAYRNIEEIQRGDLIVFHYTKDPSIPYLKRVIGKPGDRIRIKDNLLYINDVLQQKLEISPDQFKENLTQVNSEFVLFQETIDKNVHTILEHPARKLTGHSSFPLQAGNYHTVPENSLFVLGDNRDNSLDSRVLGDIPFDNVRGKVLMVFWSNGSSTINKDRFFLKIN